ncbi:GatB/YqeY domain-containing protein [Jeotgalibaca sp. MA1X17-3]|uniref:GatB/YqeY domain-containing protein n=1 Tax=Jeotgalibaca sp. MA1X17-3 TaxID=2908211 RepID=UPI001F3F1DB6|nr:GatB/YqeY domain-containing protein [Jeotgalibaca sp. MA1X17-3]UJF16348.1 GatB/YqeY domain-containing protein [Jeotgalibaca sp. MA1X17-3]
MNIQEKVSKDFIQARKNRDTLKINVLRIIKSHFDTYKIDHQKEMTEEETINYLLKEQKQTNEAIEFAEKANREDLVKENREKLAIITSYLPKMMTKEEIQDYLILKDVPSLSMKDAMKLAIGELNGKAEKKMISQVVKELLGK